MICVIKFLERIKFLSDSGDSKINVQFLLLFGIFKKFWFWILEYDVNLRSLKTYLHSYFIIAYKKNYDFEKNMVPIGITVLKRSFLAIIMKISFVITF